MNRSDIVKHLAVRFIHLTQRDTDLAVNAIVQAMNEALAKGHRIEVRGFGTLTVVRRAPRTGRNPRTGVAVYVPPKRATHFKVGKALRAAIEHAPPEDE